MEYSAYVRTLLSVFVVLGIGQLVQPLHRLARTLVALGAFALFIVLFSLRLA